MPTTSAPLLSLLCLALGLATASGCKSAEASSPQPALREGESDGPGDAVVELFTSEGCSSCPSADVVLGQLVTATGNTHVFPLAFHVDYWNSLGWEDPFSTELATQRQRAYASSFGTSSIYTPQMIVGGTEGFVGSDSSHAAAAIGRALAQAPQAKLTISVQPGEGGSVAVQVHVEPAPSSARVRVAVVERGIVSHVLAGENLGKSLHHENVVRAFVTVPIQGTDVATSLEVPRAVDRRQAEVIAYVQAEPAAGGRGMPILAAARTAMPRAR